MHETYPKESPAQIIFPIGTNDLLTNKDSNEIANEIVQLAKSGSNIKPSTKRR